MKTAANDPRTDSELLLVFGLALPTTKQALKTQYRRLAQQFPPDKNPGDAKAAERFRLIAEAFDILDNRKTAYVEPEALAKTEEGIPLSD